MPLTEQQPGRAPGADPATAWVVVVTAVLALVYVLLDDPSARAAVAYLMIGLSVLGLAWACLLAGPGGRRVTVPLLLSMVLIGVGEAVAGSRASAGTIAYPNPGEPFVALGTVFLLLAMLLKVRGGGRVSPQERLDIGIGAVSLLMFALLSGVLATEGSPEDLLVATAMLSAGVVLCAANVLIVARPDPGRSGRWTLVGCLTLVAGDVGFYADVQDGFAQQGRLSDVAYVVARGALVAMALSMRPVPPGRKVRHSDGRQRVLLAGAFALLVPVGALVGSATGAPGPAWLVLLAGSLPVALLVWRAVGTVDELAAVAERDHLTGLANRRRFVAVLEQQCARKDCFVLLVCDLDGFKEVNDTRGHAAGDQVLRDTATALLQASPSCATVARLGGDEFAVLVPGVTDHEEARAALAAAIRPRLAEVHGVGVSVGGARGPGDGPDDVLAAADRAMYADKQAAG